MKTVVSKKNNHYSCEGRIEKFTFENTQHMFWMRYKEKFSDSHSYLEACCVSDSLGFLPNVSFSFL